MLDLNLGSKRQQNTRLMMDIAQNQLEKGHDLEEDWRDDGETN